MHLYFVHCEILYVKQLNITNEHAFVLCALRDIKVMQWNITRQDAFVLCAFRDILCRVEEYH